MREFFHQIIEPGMLPYSLMLGAVLMYWLTVIIGAVGVDALDFDADVDVDVDVDMDVDGGALPVEGGMLQSLAGFLNLGQVPVTIVLSIVAVSMWLIAYFCNFYIYRNFSGAAMLVLMIGGFGVTLVISLVIAGFTTRPLRGLFKITTTRGRQHLIGKLCKIKTSRVTHDFGQAELTVDQSNLLLSVRSLDANDLKKGDEAIVADYDSQKDVYIVQKFTGENQL